MLEPSIPPPEFWLVTWAPPSLPRTQSKFHPIIPEAWERKSGLPRDAHFVSSQRKEPMMGFAGQVLGILCQNLKKIKLPPGALFLELAPQRSDLCN